MKPNNSAERAGLNLHFRFLPPPGSPSPQTFLNVRFPNLLTLRLESCCPQPHSNLRHTTPRFRHHRSPLSNLFTVGRSSQQAQLDADRSLVPGHRFVWQTPRHSNRQRSRVLQRSVNNVPEGGWNSTPAHPRLCAVVQRPHQTVHRTNQHSQPSRITKRA